MSNQPFQANVEGFRKHLLGVMITSPEYATLSNHFDATLLLGDRVLAACKEHPEFNRVWDKANCLIEVVHALDQPGDPSGIAENILTYVEIWLKALLWLVAPSRWELHVGHNPTLATIIQELSLLTPNELGLADDMWSTISDEVHQLIFLAKRYRNAVTHEPQSLQYIDKVRFLPAALVAIIAPLYKHHALLTHRLESLITYPFVGQDLYGMLRTMASERRAHLQYFAGREDWVVALQQKLNGSLKATGGYVLLSGAEGSGKSALCAKLSEELTSASDSLGAHSAVVRRSAPWLPGVLFLSGKQSNQPREIVALLVAQANTHLLSPVAFIEVDAPFDSDVSVLAYSASFEDALLVNQGFEERDSLRSRDFYNSTRAGRARTQARTHSGGSPHGKDSTSNMVILKRKLYEALDQVVLQRGHVILIIDALDEISAEGTQLGFLPEQLPSGCSALLTTRPGTIADTWFQNHRVVERLTLTDLLRTEIPLLTKVSDSAGTAERDFNDQVWQASLGWPLLVASAARSVREHGGDFTQATVDRSVDTILQRQAREWRSTSEQGDANSSFDVLKEVLALLAVFEPATPIDLDDIQGFIEYQGTVIALDDLRHQLQSVGPQVEGLDVSRIKLRLKTFADYVRTTHL